MSTDILWRVFHYFIRNRTCSVYVSVSRRNNEARDNAADGVLWRFWRRDASVKSHSLTYLKGLTGGTV